MAFQLRINAVFECKDIATSIQPELFVSFPDSQSMVTITTLQRGMIQKAAEAWMDAQSKTQGSWRLTNFTFGKTARPSSVPHLQYSKASKSITLNACTIGTDKM